jgi:dephospho-CoA kinase
MKWIGLTGGIATGKSTVAEMLRERGIPVIDADKIAHQALVVSSPVLGAIVSHFGKEILDTSGNVQRQILGKKIFKDPSLRHKLEMIVHPFVRDEVQKIKRDLVKKGVEVAVYDVPLLFEKKMEEQFDQVVVVSCDPSIQKDRLMKRNHLTSEEADQRILAQMPLSEKIKKADFVIENNGSLTDLEKQVSSLLKKK